MGQILAGDILRESGAEGSCTNERHAAHARRALSVERVAEVLIDRTAFNAGEDTAGHAITDECGGAASMNCRNEGQQFRRCRGTVEQSAEDHRHRAT